MSVIERPKRLLLAFLETGLRLVDSNLGDRSKYVGSSDVGQCPKKSWWTKFNKVNYSLKQLIIFMRGHIAEGIVREGLNNNPAQVKFTEQVEVQGLGELHFIKTHIDFVVEFPQEMLVIECKSNSSALPNGQARESHILQTILQMGLLKAQTKSSVRGKLIYLNVNNGEQEEFDVNWNEALFGVAVSRAKNLWEHMQNGTEPEGEVSELCSYCPLKGNCEKLRKNGTQMPVDVQEAVEQLKQLQEIAKKANSDAKVIKDNLLAFMEAAEVKKLIGNEITVSYSDRKGRDYISMDELRMKYPDVAKELTEKGKPFKILSVV